MDKVKGKEALTPKEEVFVQALLQGDSAVQAYRKAYPKCRYREETLARRAEVLMRKPALTRRYEALQGLEEEVADGQEVLSYLTAVMRGEKKDLRVVSCKTRVQGVDEEGRRVSREVAEPAIVEVPVRLTDTIRAAELLGKRYGLFTERVQLGPDERLQIVDDIEEVVADDSAE